MIMKSPIQIFIALAVLLAATVVTAQVYKWVDKDGKVQFTDTPPPPGASKDDPKKLTVKPASGPGTAAPPATAAKSLNDRNKDFEKRRTDAAAAAKKDAEKQDIAAKNAEVCQDATANLAELESGRPMGKASANGERSLMSDEERAAQIAKMRDVVSKSCKN